MQEFIDLYLETGMIGVVGALFVYFVVGINKKADGQRKDLAALTVEASRQTDALKNTETIVIKLIDRWDAADEKHLRQYESLSKEVHDMRADMNYLRGRINGK